MKEEIFNKAKEEIELSVAKFSIEFESWLEPIGDIINIIKILPKQITQIGDAVLELNKHDKMTAFLLLIALYRGYLYGEYFINKGRYVFDNSIDFNEYDKTEVMDEILGDGKEGDNLALKLDIFFHVLVDNSIHIHEEKISQESIEKIKESSKQQMILGLLVRFAEIKIEAKKNKNGTIQNMINQIVCLQPNFFGVGINFNKLIDFFKKN